MSYSHIVHMVPYKLTIIVIIQTHQICGHLQMTSNVPSPPRSDPEISRSASKPHKSIDAKQLT